MPDLDLSEADLCPHCGAVLREPPDCCTKALQEYGAELAWEEEMLRQELSELGREAGGA